MSHAIDGSVPYDLAGRLRSQEETKAWLDELAMKTLAEELKTEEEALRRRFVHHTRPKGPLSLKEAMELSERMQGKDG